MCSVCDCGCISLQRARSCIMAFAPALLRGRHAGWLGHTLQRRLAGAPQPDEEVAARGVGPHVGRLPTVAVVELGRRRRRAPLGARDRQGIGTRAPEQARSSSRSSPLASCSAPALSQSVRYACVSRAHLGTLSNAPQSRGLPPGPMLVATARSLCCREPPLQPPLRLCRYRHASKSAPVMRAALLGPGKCSVCAPARGRRRAAGARGTQTRRRPAGRQAPAGRMRTGGGATHRRRTRRSRWRLPAAARAAASVSRSQHGRAIEKHSRRQQQAGHGHGDAAPCNVPREHPATIVCHGCTDGCSRRRRTSGKRRYTAMGAP